MALKGIRVLELAGLAPVPYCGMILADFGADVIRVDRNELSNPDILSRGKRSIGINLKSKAGQDLLRELVKKADVLIEPFRPGVMEKLNLGPDQLLEINPRLIFARLTGWGQSGPFSQMAGHDINYIAISGALGAAKRASEKPMFTSNVLGDFAAGGMLCAMGILLALVERSKSGKGQVVDSAMCDGATYLAAFQFMGLNAHFNKPAGNNLLDSGAAQYEVYETKDGRFMSVGALEPQFYQAFLQGLGLDKADDLPFPMNANEWPKTKARFAAIFKSKTRDEWCKIFDGTDACVAPVLELHEVKNHPHNKARGVLLSRSPSELEPAPAPRLSRTPGKVDLQLPRLQVGQHTEALLKEYGFTPAQIKELEAKGIIAVRSAL